MLTVTQLPGWSSQSEQAPLPVAITPRDEDSMVVSQSPNGRYSPRDQRHRTSRSRGRNNRSTSPGPSPGSWNLDRGRSRVRKISNPFSEENLRRRGYHSILSSFGKVFHVEKRWKLNREMGSGAYGVVISAADEISGETVAIKLVTRVFDKVQLAKRALREITLLRHFSNHENITGLIDVDAIAPDFNEIYIFMEPMEADLHQIIKSGQVLSNEHVQYFIYQVLRGMKYIHSASVIHRDLKPGNLLVNADCELKICDFGLSRGFNSAPDENATHLTEYVATRWYRAPEIMLAFTSYTTAIDMWSIGCILAELLLGKPLFKGKDYVDQLNKVLNVLGTPGEEVMGKIGSEKARVYVRSLPIKKTIPFQRVLPSADPLAIDLLNKMLAFDPDQRISVIDALAHPWLSTYHDEADEPTCPEVFQKWKELEELETIEDFRKALWDEIEDYRREVRGIKPDVEPPTETLKAHEPVLLPPDTVAELADRVSELLTNPARAHAREPAIIEPSPREERRTPRPGKEPSEEQTPVERTRYMSSPGQFLRRPSSIAPADPVVNYALRSSMLGPLSRQGSTYGSPISSSQHLPALADSRSSDFAKPPMPGTIAFPTQGYVVPARSRAASMVGSEFMARKLLRTLSTVSIHESAEAHPGGLAEVAPIGKFIVEDHREEADAPISEMPREFNQFHSQSQPLHQRDGSEKKKGMFQV